jgi:hypothetical protein
MKVVTYVGQKMNHALDLIFSPGSTGDFLFPKFGKNHRL